MIPANSFTTQPARASFQPPYNLPYTQLYQRVLGGAALGDPSQGRQLKSWEVLYQAGQIVVRPVGESAALALTVPDVRTVSLAFDNNMGVVLAWQVNNTASLYYYDITVSQYSTRQFPDVTSSRVCVDDARDFYTSSSDVIFGYTTQGNLYYRQQRDRYDIPRLVGSTTKSLQRLGPSVTNRLQFELL